MSLVVLLVLVGVVGGGMAAAMAYDRSTSDQFLPGVTVAGMAVAGLEPAEVVSRLQTLRGDVAGRNVTLSAGSHHTTVTLEQLGVHSDAADAVTKARAEARRMGLAGRVWHRLMDKPVRSDYPVSYRLDPGRVDSAVSELAKKVQRPAVDAKMDSSTGFLTFTSAVPGQAMDQVVARQRLLGLGEELANDRTTASSAEAPLQSIPPKVSGYPDAILIRLGENKLYHYENGTLARSYTVATGLPEFPTPMGRFEITLKRRNPVWVNPDPSGWGKSLPPRIEAGPGNPLGTRALNLNAPGIRIHGTSNVGSLGRPASHGCIRMALPDVEHLFERVEENTPVVIIMGPKPLRPPAPPPPPANAFGPANAPIDLAGAG